MAKAKFYEFTTSGSYINSRKEIFDFDNVKVLVPFTELQEVAEMHLQSRYMPEAIRTDERYAENRFHKLRQTHIDDVKTVEAEMSFIGKNLKELDDKELQDLATAKDLRSIPLPKRQSGMSIRDMRVRAYIAYKEKILKQPVSREDREDIERDFAKLPAIIIDAAVRTDKSAKVSNEEIIEGEQKSNSMEDDPSKRFTLDDLMKLADQKKIPYDKNMDKEKLFKFLYEKLYT